MDNNDFISRLGIPLKGGSPRNQSNYYRNDSPVRKVNPNYLQPSNQANPIAVPLNSPNSLNYLNNQPTQYIVRDNQPTYQQNPLVNSNLPSPQLHHPLYVQKIEPYYDFPNGFKTQQPVYSVTAKLDSRDEKISQLE